MRAMAILAAAICFLHPWAGSCQTPLEIGDRVRILGIGERSWVVGWVNAIEGDSLALAVDHAYAGRRGCGNASPTCARALDTTTLDTLWIEVGEFVMVERSVGTQRNARRVGLAAGLVGGLAGALFYATCTGCYAEWALAGAVLVGGPSFLIGAAVGHTMVTDKWQPVATPLPQRSRTGSSSGIILWPAISLGRDGRVDLAVSVR